MSHSEYTILEAVNILNDKDISVLVIDTCAILDVIRVPARVDSHTRAEAILKSVSHILSMVKENPPKLSIVIPPLVPSEWEEHQSKIIKEVEKHLIKLDSMIKVAAVSARAFNKEIKLTTFSNLNIHDKLLTLSKRLLYSGTWLESKDNVQQRSTNRAVANVPPARKGAVKDCIIYEHCLELFRLLRENNFNKKCVFLTSNTKDFCDETNFSPQEPIKTELDQVSANLTTNWERTLHLLNNDQ